MTFLTNFTWAVENITVCPMISSLLNNSFAQLSLQVIVVLRVRKNVFFSKKSIKSDFFD